MLTGRLNHPIRLGAIMLLALAPASFVHASNTKHARTPVIWDGGGGDCGLPVLQTPCMTLHDRGDGPLHIPYGIPYEDTDVAADEVADSRTHQFAAFCRPADRRDPLPSWFTQSDVAAGEAAGQVLPGEVPLADVLELRDDWDGCWYRINADDERRPITCEMALEGVDWDAAAVPAGVYTIDGYVYEPQFNFWILRPGVVKLHDGDPDAVGPAAAITTKELTLFRNEVTVIEGCVDAVEGSTLTTYWALDEEPEGGVEWFEYAAGLPIAGAEMAFEFAPPAETVGQLAMLRVDVEDPMGRSYTAYMSDRIAVIDADGPNGCGGEGSFIGGSSCEESGDGSGGGVVDTSSGSAASTAEGTGSTSGIVDTTTSSGGAMAPQVAASQGCECAAGARGTASGVLVLLLFRRRRRERHA